MLILIAGLPGTGKTTIAKDVAKKTKAALLRTDVIRKELIKKPTYSKEEAEIIFGEMFARAKSLLSKKRNVVLDAVFGRETERKKAKILAKQLNTDFKIIEIICKEKIIKRRIGKRVGDESDADFSIYLKLKDLLEPITEKHIIIDNYKGVGGVKAELDRLF